MNIGNVHTSPILIPWRIDHCTGGIGARDEYWEGLHPCIIHCEGYTPHDRGYRGTR